MKFFIDNCLSPKYPTILGALDHGEVTSLRQHFPVDTIDEVWIPAIGSQGWVLITKDRSQRADPAEREALRKAGVISFYLAKTFDHQKFDDQVWRVVRFWPAICSAARGAKKGACFRVTINGKIEVWPP